MAERLGISQKSYSNLERAENDITVDVLLKVADIYQISLSKIMEISTENILNSNSQNGGISCINNNQAIFYNCEKEEFQQLLRSQSELILAQQQMIRDLQK